MKSSDQILFLLKTRGARSAQEVAEHLGMTSMGARRQLEAAQEKGLVETQDVPSKIGRPARQWCLTTAGHARFPDRHSDLTVQLIDQARVVFGEAGLERLIAARDEAIEANYMLALGEQLDMAARAAALAQIRNAEGYMADTQVQPDGSVLLIENHCPVCAAAKACQNFCRSELDIFQRVMGEACRVERTEHILAGARRCVYVIRPA